MDIKILGTGCAKCNEAENAVKETVAEAGIDVFVEKITDIMKIAEYGVIMTPAVVIDGEIKSVGNIPKKKDILKWIGK